MVAASRCFGARSLVQGGGLPNARRACHSSNLLGPLGRCSGVYCFLGSTGGCCVIGREHFLRGSSSSFDALRGCYTLSRGNATSERERMGGVKRCSFYKHMNGFLSDSSLARWNGGAGESISTPHIPSKILLPFLAIKDNFSAAYGNYWTVSTQASADEQDLPNETFKKILSEAERDPFSFKETCCSYIEKLCHSGNLSNIACLLKDLRDRQTLLTPKAYRTLLVAAAEANNFELSSLVFKDLLRTTNFLDSSTFTNVAKAFKKTNDVELLLKFIREISELMFPRSANVFNRIMVGFADSGQAEKALLIFREMKNLKCKPDTVTWNIILAVLAKAGQLDQVLSEFCSMKESGLVPDLVTYNTLINCFKNNGRMDLCSNFAHEMRGRGIEPDLRTYTALIDGYGRLGNIEEALKLFDEMKQKQIRPSIYVYRSLISNLKRAGKLELALSLSEEMTVLASQLVGPEDFRRRNR